MSMDSSAPPLSAHAFDFNAAVTWCMHCAEGPVPLAAGHAVRRFMERETRPWELRWEEDFQGIPQTTRTLAARLCSAAVQDITLTATTSTALTTIAQAYPWSSGDEVVVPLAEFPSNYWPWQALTARGVRVREVPLWSGQRGAEEAWRGRPPQATDDAEGRLLEALGPATRILAVSWVRFQDGLRLDLARLAVGCRERGVDLVVDGIQGAGVVPISVAGLAAFATGGHKGLLAPQGQGLMWTSEAFRHKLAPAGSWLSVQDATDFSRPSTDFARPWVDDGCRFEQGVPNLLGCAALNCSLEMIVGADVEAIYDHVRALQMLLIDGLMRLPSWRREGERLATLFAADKLGPTLALHHGRADEVDGRARLDDLLVQAQEAGVYLSIREGYLRIALHGWHTPRDVAAVIAQLSGR